MTSKQFEAAALHKAFKDVTELLDEALTALEFIGECTWDKRHPDELRAACDNASEMAGAYDDFVERKKTIMKTLNEAPRIFTDVMEEESRNIAMHNLLNTPITLGLKHHRPE